ncbi:MAG: arginase family protein [Legionellales bacterium]
MSRVKIVQQPFEQLTRILCPQGIKTVTTGSGEIGRFLQARYGSVNEMQVKAIWEENLHKIPQAKIIILGVPMDTGAGFERGAFKGPLGIRSQFLSKKDFYQNLETHGIIDIGDVRGQFQSVADDMASPQFIQATRASRGWGVLGEALQLPISYHSILERTLDLIGTLNPQAKVLLLGGDHSLSWVPIQYLSENNPNQNLGIVHFDAHTDLMEERDGSLLNFATWAYHANNAIGRGNRLQQLGIRVSGHTREHWETTLQLRQIRMEEISARTAEDVIAEVIANLVNAGVTRVYISNDIDGTDPTYAASTGTMEFGGMMPEFVHALINALGQSFDVVGSDLVEVAPPLKWHVHGEPSRTTQTAAYYVVAQMNAMLQGASILFNPFSQLIPSKLDELMSFPLLA